MDLLTKAQLERLAGSSPGPGVSVFMPTHRAGAETRQDPIRLRNLLSEAEENLKRGGMPPTEAREMVAPAHELLSDAVFWRHQADGLALFLSGQGLQRYRLPLRFEELAVVADRYHVKPLLPLLAGDGVFFVLALSQNEVRLVEATRHTAGEVDLPADVPKSLAEALRYDDPEKELQFHTGTAGGGGARPAVFHGHEPDSGEGLLRFFRRVDLGVRGLLGARGESPLVLAGVDYLLPVYREASDYPNVPEEGVTGNPEGLPPEELRDRAWPIVGPRFDADREDAVARHARLAGTGQTSSDLREVVAAAYFGRVDVLFAARGRRRWGSFDAASGEAREHGEPERGDGDLLDFAAVQTFLNGGTVYVVEPEKVPGGADASALMRY